jgi:hypothetical protein
MVTPSLFNVFPDVELWLSTYKKSITPITRQNTLPEWRNVG